MASNEWTVRVTGLKELGQAALKTDAELAETLREGLIAGAELVASETRSLLQAASDARGPYSSIERTVSGVKPQVSDAALRQGRAYVTQTVRKSRRPQMRRGNWGGIQMQKGFIPALVAKQPEVLAVFDKLLSSLANRNF